MKLHQALNVSRGDVVAFVGAGGKTSGLFLLAQELVALGWRVLATTTTRMARAQLTDIPAVLHIETAPQDISATLEAERFVFLYSAFEGEKVRGAAPEQIPYLLDTLNADALLIEADGARGLALKAPYPHEPVIPSETSLVVPLVSLAALGKPLTDEFVYNPQAIQVRYGFGSGERIKSAWIAQVLRDETLMLKGLPPQARVIALLNQVPPNTYLRGRARLIAQLALKGMPQAPRPTRLNAVAIGDLHAPANPIHEVQRHVGAVVLAAGLSSRMGSMKVLLSWQDGKTILEHILLQLIAAKPDHICVVTGHMADAVRAIAAPLGVQVVHNPDYQQGEMLSSVKVGLSQLPAHLAAAMIVLGDQPRIQVRTVQQVMSAYAEGVGDIIAPSYQMRRGHPILIDRRYWRELLDLPPNGAPRDVINKYAANIGYVNVNTDSILTDVDTPQAYQEERRRAGL